MCAEVVETLLLATDNRNTTLAALAHGANPLAYTPYGVQSARAPVQNHLGFNGQLREAATGCYHLGNGHRLYNPVLMRFHSPDRLSPFGQGGLNAYAYCLGDPVNLVDPTGRVPEWLQPVLTIGLHVAIFTVTLVGAIVAPPTGVALLAARASLVGSPISIVGAGLQLAGVKEGRWVSAAGTAISGAAVATRVGIGIRRLATEPDLRGLAAARLKALIGFKASALPTTKPTPTPTPALELELELIRR